MQCKERQKFTCFEINILACPSSPRAEATKAVKNIGTRGDMMELVWKKEFLRGDRNKEKASPGQTKILKAIICQNSAWQRHNHKNALKHSGSADDIAFLHSSVTFQEIKRHKMWVQLKQKWQQLQRGIILGSVKPAVPTHKNRSCWSQLCCTKGALPRLCLSCGTRRESPSTDDLKYP